MDDAELPLALEGALFGAFGTSGQRCTATSRPGPRQGLRPVRCDAPGTPEIVQDRLIPRRVRRHGARRLGGRGEEGARVHCSRRTEGKILDGGERLHGGIGDQGHFIAPTVVETHHGTRISKEEIFGPFPSAMRFGSYEEAVKIANDVDYGLSASIYTEDAPGDPGGRGPGGRNHVHQRPHYRGRGPAAVRWHQEHRQRRPGGRLRRHRGVHRAQDGLRGLLPEAPQGPVHPR